MACEKIRMGLVKKGVVLMTLTPNFESHNILLNLLRRCIQHTLRRVIICNIIGLQSITRYATSEMIVQN
jgi:hypothetical protein